MTDSFASVYQADRHYCWHPYTQHGTEPEPLGVVAARDAVLTLADGSELIDGISSWWACLHGHGRPELAAAIGEQAARLDHVLFAGATHEPAALLAKELVAVTPDGLDRVFYSDNGSTAVEVALKMVVQAWNLRGQPQRQVFIGLEGSYHGDTFGAMGVGDPDPFFLPFRSMLFRAERVPPQLAAFEAVIEQVGHQVAGILIEPLVQGAAGMRMHSPELLRDLRELCDRLGLPLIADEVMTGFGRTGAMFACELAGISPDLMCLGKGLTAGMLPLAVTMVREEMFGEFLSEDRSRAFFHGHTFTANPIACALARRSLVLCREEGTPDRLAAIGCALEERLEVLRDSEHVLELRRRGGIVAVEFRPEEQSQGGYLASRGPRLRAAALGLGVLLRPLGDVLYAMPPACTTEVQVDQIAKAMIELSGLAASPAGSLPG